MAKKRRKSKRRSQAGATRPASARPTGAPPDPDRSAKQAERPRSDRAERKEMARQERELARRRVMRRRRVRRLVTIAGIAGAVAAAGFLVFRSATPGSVPDEVLELARAAGCGDVETPEGSAPGGEHLAPGEGATYTDTPATSGRHAPAPLPAEPAVHAQPISEEAAVHNLEHGYVILYYRAEGPEALSADVVTRLAEVAEGQDKVFLAPYPELKDGTSLAMVAWNKRWQCPATLSASDAETIASSFVDAYKSSPEAPEGSLS